MAASPSLASHPYRGRLADFVREAGGRVARFLGEQRALNSVEEGGETGPVEGGETEEERDTVVFPTVQMGQLGITQVSR